MSLPERCEAEFLPADARRIIHEEIARAAEGIVGVGNASGWRARFATFGGLIGRSAARPASRDQAVANAVSVANAGAALWATVSAGSPVVHRVATDCGGQNKEGCQRQQNAFHGGSPVRVQRGLLNTSSAPRPEKLKNSEQPGRRSLRRLSQIPQPPKSTEPPPWEPRFTLGGMFLVSFLLACIFAGGHYAYQAVRGGTGSRLVLILAILAGPMLIMMVVSLMYSLTHRRPGRRRGKR